MLRHIDNIEDRADRLLQQIAKSTDKRDALLAEVAVVVEQADNPHTGTLEPLLREMVEVRDCALPSYVERSAELAHTMNSCATLAQHSTQHHNRLVALLERVQTAKRVASAMMAMHDDVSAASEAMAANDVPKAVALVRSYQDAREVVSSAAALGGDSREDAASAAAAVVDSAIASVRVNAKAALETTLHTCIENNDKLGIMEATKLLAHLGYKEEAGRLYCTWLCDHTVLGLKKLVDRELAKMEDPSQVAMTYLVLCSQLLDTVAATFESEEGFVKDNFGSQGALLLIRELHQRGTAQCVPVLTKFRAARHDVLEQLLSKDAEVRGILDARQAAFASPATIPTKTLPDGSGIIALSSSSSDEDEDEEDDREARDAADTAEENGRMRVQASASSAASSSPAGVTTAGKMRLTASASPAPPPPSCSAADVPIVLDEAALSRSVGAARQADQALEDMSHLVSCCDIYMAFAEEKQSTYKALVEKEKKAAATTGGGGGSSVDETTTSSSTAATDAAWSTRGTALLEAVQDMLSLYVPVQVSYFQSAFYHALQLQWSSVRNALVVEADAARAAAGNNNNNNSSSSNNNNNATATAAASPTSLLAGLSTWYAAAAGGVADLGTMALVGGGSGGSAQTRAQALNALEQQQRAYKFYSDHATITLAEDVFYFVRVSLHRAINTRSTQITSAIVMSAIDLIQTRLVPELRRHAGPRALRRHRRHAHDAPGTPFLPPPALLRWTAVTEQSMMYTRKLSEELRRLAASQFKGRDLLRFQELGHDMQDVSEEMLKTEWKPWLAKDARVCYDGLMPPHLRRLQALSYCDGLTEEVFYHYELSDPWVQACMTDWAALFEYCRPLLDCGSEDQLVHDAATLLVRDLRAAWMQKRFNTLGALQVDKEVRALRDFFFGRVQEISLRTVFAPISLMSTLLLSDSPRDALEEARNTALTADEKKAVLLLRPDFNKEEVMALRL